MAAGVAATGYYSAWQVLAELQLQTGRAAAAASTCAKGLAFWLEREASGHPPCPEARVLQSQCICFGTYLPYSCMQQDEPEG